jgi:hypothetical protein
MPLWTRRFVLWGPGGGRSRSRAASRAQARRSIGILSHARLSPQRGARSEWRSSRMVREVSYPALRDPQVQHPRRRRLSWMAHFSGSSLRPGGPRACSAIRRSCACTRRAWQRSARLTHRHAGLGADSARKRTGWRPRPGWWGPASGLGAGHPRHDRPPALGICRRGAGPRVSREWFVRCGRGTAKHSRFWDPQIAAPLPTQGHRAGGLDVNWAARA